MPHERDIALCGWPSGAAGIDPIMLVHPSDPETSNIQLCPVLLETYHMKNALASSYWGGDECAIRQVSLGDWIEIRFTEPVILERLSDYVWQCLGAAYVMKESGSPDTAGTENIFLEFFDGIWSVTYGFAPEAIALESCGLGPVRAYEGRVDFDPDNYAVSAITIEEPPGE